METDRAHTLLILRRMGRKMIPGTWVGVFNPMQARPEERRFQVLDKDERYTGQLEYARFEMRLMSASEAGLSTPWGEARIRHEKGGTVIHLSDRELVRLSVSVLRRKTTLAFPNGTTLSLHQKKGWRRYLEYTDETGSIGVLEEGGKLPEGRGPSSIQLTKDDIKMLPKQDRPTSNESLDYVQYRIIASGLLPVNRDDAIRAICIFESYLCLIGEIPTG